MCKLGLKYCWNTTNLPTKLMRHHLGTYSAKTIQNKHPWRRHLQVTFLLPIIVIILDFSVRVLVFITGVWSLEFYSPALVSFLWGSFCRFISSIVCFFLVFLCFLWLTSFIVDFLLAFPCCLHLLWPFCFSLLPSSLPLRLSIPPISFTCFNLPSLVYWSLPPYIC